MAYLSLFIIDDNLFLHSGFRQHPGQGEREGENLQHQEGNGHTGKITNLSLLDEI